MPVATCAATALEKRPPVPVDRIIPDPLFTSTHAITIDATPEQVWPWLAYPFIQNGRALLLQVLSLMQPDPIVLAMPLCAPLLALVPFGGLASAPSPREPVIAGRVPSHRRLPGKGLLIACVGSVVVYGLGDLVSGLLYHGYSYKDQWISELTAFGSPVRPLMVTAILLHGLLLLAFGVGIWRAAERRTLRWIGVLLVLAGLIGFPTHTVFAMSSRWMTTGFNDTMHALLSLTFSLIVFAAVVLSAVAFKGWFRFFSIATIPVLAGFGAASAFAIQGIAQNSTPWAGAFERINAYAYFAWLILLAVTVTRWFVDQGRRHSDVENEHPPSDRVGHIGQEGRLRT